MNSKKKMLQKEVDTKPTLQQLHHAPTQVKSFGVDSSGNRTCSKGSDWPGQLNNAERTVDLVDLIAFSAHEFSLVASNSFSDS